MSVEVSRDQLDEIANATRFSENVATKLANLPTDDQPSYSTRANECFAQAVCWCKLDLALHSSITQENQCLAVDVLTAELLEAATKRVDYITAYILDELDLPPGDTTLSVR